MGNFYDLLRVNNSILFQNSTSDTPVTHWVPWLSVHSVEEEWNFDRFKIPGEIWRTLQYVLHGIVCPLYDR